MASQYTSILGYPEGATRIHIHFTVLDTRSCGEPHKHSHKAEEALYLIEGEAEYAIQDKTVKVGPGDLLFFRPNDHHGPVRFLSDRMRYLVIRSVEPDDEPCCCGEDRAPSREPAQEG